MANPHEAVSGEALSFGDWKVLAKAVASSRGIIPLDQVSCCTYDEEPLNIRNIAIGVIICLAGLFAFTTNALAALLLLAIGGIIVFMSMQSKRTFRLYSTSGYFFQSDAQEMDIDGNRIRQFEAFNTALLEHRHLYIAEMRP